jgi:tetratricopeptide (TPR) repeat protein
MHPRRLVNAVLVLLLLFAPIVLDAQRGRATAPPRPALTSTADTNDSQAYYAFGLVNFSTRPRDAADAFYWALRLDPHNAEAMYGQWAAFWMSDSKRYIGYIVGDRAVVDSRDIVHNDSLIWRAYQINPLLHRALDIRIREHALRTLRVEVNWHAITDPYDRGYLHYTRGEMGPAVERFREVLRRNRRDTRTAARFYLARSHYHMGNSDSAAHHFQVLLEEMRARDEKKIVFWYESKALMEYRIGHIYGAGKRPDEAREAYGRALTEDLSFYMSHVRLGELARAEGDTQTAVNVYALAVDLEETDPVVRTAYASILTDADRADDAEVQARKAIELEPYYALAYYELARSLDRQSKAVEASDYYHQFVARAPRNRTREINLSRRRIAALRGAVAAAGSE